MKRKELESILLYVYIGEEGASFFDTIVGLNLFSNKESMEQGQMPVCHYCDTVIEEDHPETTLLCNHSVHTYCFLRLMLQDSPRYIQCGVCHTPLVLPSMIHGTNNVDIVYTNTEAQDISGVNPTPNTTHTILTSQIIDLLNTNAEFKKDAKRYQEQQFKTVAARKAAQTIRKQKYKLFRNALSELKYAMELKKKEFKSSLKGSMEYKTYEKEARKCQTLYKKLRETYPIIPEDEIYFKHILSKKRGFTRWPLRLVHNPMRLLSCWYRLRY